jgi:hypothetical protein
MPLLIKTIQIWILKENKNGKNIIKKQEIKEKYRPCAYDMTPRRWLSIFRIYIYTFIFRVKANKYAKKYPHGYKCYA